MRKALEIEKNIEEINKLYNSVVELIEKKQSELYRLKEKHREHLEKHVGGAQAAAQRREMRSFEDELADCEISREILEKKLTAENEALELAGIYGQVQNYQQTKETFYGQVKDIVVIMQNLKSVLDDLQVQVNSIWKLQRPVDLLEHILNLLRTKGLAFKPFIEQGEARAAVGEDNNIFIDETVINHRGELEFFRSIELPLQEIGTQLLNCLALSSMDRLKDLHQKQPVTTGLLPRSTPTNTVKMGAGRDPLDLERENEAQRRKLEQLRNQGDNKPLLPEIYQ